MSDNMPINCSNCGNTNEFGRTYCWVCYVPFEIKKDSSATPEAKAMSPTSINVAPSIPPSPQASNKSVLHMVAGAVIGAISLYSFALVSPASGVRVILAVALVLAFLPHKGLSSVGKGILCLFGIIAGGSILFIALAFITCLSKGGGF